MRKREGTGNDDQRGIIVEFVTVQLEVVATATVEGNADTPAELVLRGGLHRSVQEQFWVVTFDDSGALRRVFRIAQGGYHDAEVPLAPLFGAVLLSGARRFVAAHNHPGGELVPSDNDLHLTHRLSKAADLLALGFEDHLIVSPAGGWYSMRDHGQMRG